VKIIAMLMGGVFFFLASTTLASATCGCRQITPIPTAKTDLPTNLVSPTPIPTLYKLPTATPTVLAVKSTLPQNLTRKNPTLWQKLIKGLKKILIAQYGWL
jgi:hypothetical protein